MKQIIVLFFILSIVSSCTGFVDDSDETCIQNCTYFKGRIVDAQAIGVANVDLSLRYYGSSFGYERLIAKATTDEEGYYELHGELKEIREDGNIEKTYTIEVDTATLNVALRGRNDLIKPSNLIHRGYTLIDDFHVRLNQKDTTLQVPNFIVPKKSSVFVTLNNYKPTSQSSSFYIMNKIKYGFDSEWTSADLFYGNAYDTTSTFVVEAVIGLNIISIKRWKGGGGWQNTIDSIYVQNSPSDIELEYEY